MNCLRCQGLMMAIELRDASSQDAVGGWRCLLCGETTDPGIQANRASHQSPPRSRARVPGAPPVHPGKGRPKSGARVLGRATE